MIICDNFGKTKTGRNLYQHLYIAFKNGCISLSCILAVFFTKRRHLAFNLGSIQKKTLIRNFTKFIVIMNKRIVLFMLFLLPLLAFGQVKTKHAFLDANKKVCDSSDAVYARTIYYFDTMLISGREETRYINGQLLSDISYSNIEEGVREGLSIKFFEDGKMKSKVFYKENKLHDSLLTYYSSGQLKRKDAYDDGKLISGHCYAENGADTTFYDYLIMPLYPGGEIGISEFISKEIKYPVKALRKHIQGSVLLKFVVGKDGKVKDVEVIKHIDPLLDEEAVRVISRMKKWKPGMMDGEAVEVFYKIPITFRLN